MAAEIRIDDLLHPVLNEAQKAALAHGDATPVDLTEEAILAEARKRTGLDDFGPEDFRERLRLLLDEWNADPGLSGLHRITLWGYITRHMANRLLIRDYLKHHAEVHEEVIKKPIIVVGMPRSGTTHLVNLLAADPRLRSLPLWESYEPLPLPGEPMLPGGVDPRYQRTADAWTGMQQVVPLLAAMHPMEPQHIHEELELMGPDLASYNFEWISRVPKWRDYYYAHDQTPHYEYMKTVLKILQSIRGPKRWVLKCPQHLEQLPVLRKVFPDATIAVTHRDPVAVIQSAVTMIAYGHRIYRKSVEPKPIIDYWIERVDHLLRACVRDRDLWPDSQSIDVPFHEFMADDLAMVARIHNKAGLPEDKQARAAIAHFLAEHPRGKEGRVVYNLRRDFGVDPEALRARFQYYFDAFPVKAEVR
ncbi:MAG TPA: sulfotransferase [Alphaproteobacteria bacterium]|nr:sulfotransferase [Alphaproteobacteria bacterium]